MQVYLVMGSEEYGEHTIVVAAFSTKELAEKYAQLQNELEDSGCDYFYILEEEVDKYKITSDSKVVWYYEYILCDYMLINHPDSYNDDEQITRIYDKDQICEFNCSNGTWTIHAYSTISYNDARNLAWNEYHKKFN